MRANFSQSTKPCAKITAGGQASSADAQRQPDHEARTTGPTLLKRDAAGVLLDHGMDERQAESRAALLGGKERLEDARTNLDRDARTAVLNRQKRLARLLADLDPDRAA